MWESLLAGEVAGEGDLDWEEGPLTGCVWRAIGLRTMSQRATAWALSLLRRPPLLECSPEGAGCCMGVAQRVRFAAVRPCSASLSSCRWRLAGLAPP